jgi:hypothetical protein
MTTTETLAGPSLDATVTSTRTLPLWLTAIGLAALGTWLLFAAAPGINCLLVVVAVSAGHLALTRAQSRRRDGLPLALAVGLAGGAALTSNGAFHFWIGVGIVVQFAVLTLLDAGVPARSLGPLRVALAPFRAAFLMVREFAHRIGTDTPALLRDERNARTLRGIGLALPVVVLFFLILAGADPTFAAWQDAFGDVLSDFQAPGRLVFFAALSILLLGFYGVALRGPNPRAAGAQRPPHAALSDTERFIVLGSILALFVLFLGLQASYLFGNPGARRGSGLTFAEALHRGFVEITIVVTLSAWLIIALDRYAIRGDRERRLRVVQLLLVAACLLLLVSAYHRLVSYQAAYGYTAFRIYVGIYVAAAALALALLAREICTNIDLPRLTRRVMIVAVLALCAPVYWNSAAWVVRRNLARSETTGQLDVAYLARGLSADAVPAAVEALPRLPADQAAFLVKSLMERHAHLVGPARERAQWYEWNLRREAAQRALTELASNQ